MDSQFYLCIMDEAQVLFHSYGGNDDDSFLLALKRLCTTNSNIFEAIIE